MAKQVRINTSTGEVTGNRVHPSAPLPAAKWFDERREDAPEFDPETQVVEQDNKLVDEEYVYGFTVRSMTAQELVDRAEQNRNNHNAPIFGQINEIERNSARSVRENVLEHGPDAGGKTPKQRLQDVEDQIVALRAQLQ